MNDFEIISGMAGFSTVKSIQKFLHSPKGRLALRKYLEFKTDIRRSIAKYNIARMHFIRAFFNPGDIINSDGELIDGNEKPLNGRSLKILGELAFCIEGIESEIIGIEKTTNKPIRKTKVKLCDRNKSIDILTKLYKIFDESEDNDFDEKSIHEMSDDERFAEMRRLYKKGVKLLEFKGDHESEEGNNNQKK